MATQGSTYDGSQDTGRLLEKASIKQRERMQWQGTGEQEKATTSSELTRIDILEDLCAPTTMLKTERD